MVATVEEVRNMIASCKICAEGKPQFIKSNDKKLVKATQPFEQLSIDFKGQIPFNTNNKYFLLMSTPNSC